MGLILGMIAAGMLAQAGDRPNVVFILSDDQGWGDYGFMGQPRRTSPLTKWSSVASVKERATKWT